MCPLFGPKYNDTERAYLAELERINVSIVRLGATAGQAQLMAKEAKRMARKMLDECIREAERQGLRGVKNLGDTYVRDATFVARRLSVGLNLDDIIKFWNRDFVWLVAEEKMQNAIRMGAYINLKERRGMLPEEVARELRRMFIYFGDPEKSSPAFVGEDADIFYEFASRHEYWRGKYTEDAVQQLADSYSTYNAMVRDLIRRGEM